MPEHNLTPRLKRRSNKRQIRAFEPGKKLKGVQQFSDRRCNA
jgi:hypothetical protein